MQRICELHRVITRCGRFVILFAGRERQKDDVTVPTDEAISSSINKVQAWLDSTSDEIIFMTAASCISPASCIILLDDDDDDDNAMQKADTVILTDSNSSDDLEATVGGIDKIQDRTEAICNQHTFDAALDVACVHYVCDEMCAYSIYLLV